MNRRTFIDISEESLDKYFRWRKTFLTYQFDQIQKYIDKKWYKFNIMYKEKYWRFDISAWYPDNELFERCSYIEETTPHICIDCGQYLYHTYWWENRRDLWWVLPRCSKCFKRALKEREELRNSRRWRESELNTTTESESKNNDQVNSD